MHKISPIYIVIDLFCGAGGTTTGMALAVDKKGNLITKVIAAVNHDPIAIKSHWANHPDVKHFNEDIRILDLTDLITLTEKYRKLYPHALLILWASLECTNFSKAKGGQPRDADSRTLADHLDRYILAVDPDYVMIENVVEFMSWGPLDEKGKPVSRKSGIDWMAWCTRLCTYGYRDEWKEMNSANYGAYTSRNRLFGCFAKSALPIIWPKATHAKIPSMGTMFELPMHKWKAVKEVLDFTDEGKSIFSRKTPLSDKTLERIYAGLIKYIAGGKDNFIAKYYSGRPEGKVISTDGPAGTIKTVDGQSLIQPVFIAKYNSTSKNGNHVPPSVEDPCPAVTTQNRLGLITTSFITQRNTGKPDSKIVDVDGPARTLTATGGNQDIIQAFIHAYYGNGDNNSSINEPAPTIPTKDRCALIQTHYIDKQYSGPHNHSSIEQPAGALLSNPKMSLVTTDGFIMHTNYSNNPTSIDNPHPVITANRKWSYLVNPSWGGNTSSTDVPSPVIVARQDKAPMYIVISEAGEMGIPVYESDSDIMKKIKQFMVLYHIVDIKMRMLKILELKKIQGFPADYILNGSQKDQKKFIGNSVVPHVVRAWIEHMAS